MQGPGEEARIFGLLAGIGKKFPECDRRVNTEGSPTKSGFVKKDGEGERFFSKRK